MKQLMAVACKEWREVRWVVVTALVTFVALPIVAGIEGRRYANGFVFAASPWVMLFGGILAVVAGATSLTRDLNGRLADFWQSRPIATWRWLAIKYLVGLAVVIASCLIPLLIEQWHDSRHPQSDHLAVVLAAWFPFIVAVQYGLGFLCGATMRKGGTAIMLALAVSLLVYCLPILLSPLRWLDVSESITNSTTHGQHMFFAFATIVLSAALLALATLAVVRQWQIRSPQRVTYWSIGGGIVLVVASAALHLGTNLPVTQTFDLEPNDQIVAIAADAHHGAMVYMKDEEKSSYWGAGLRAIEIDSGEVRLGPEILLRGWVADARYQAWLPNHPENVFLLNWSPVSNQPQKMRLELAVLNLQSPAKPLVATVELGTVENMPVMQSIGGQLYVMWWNHAVLIDVGDPVHPRVTSAPTFFEYSLLDDGSSPDLGASLLPVEGVSFRERLAASVAYLGNLHAAVTGDLLITTHAGALSTFRMSRIFSQSFTQTDNAVEINTVAKFRRIGGCEASMLENIIGDAPVAMATSGPLLYVSSQSRSFGMPLAHVVVFDLSDPVHPRPIGHFAAPHEERLQLCPLPDGRLLAGGHKLYLVGAPSHHGL